MDFDPTLLERASQTFREDMWETACEDAVQECGIVSAWFGPVQATVFETLPDAPTMNAILGAAERGAVEEGHLENAIAWADEFEVGYRVAVARGRPGTAAAEALLNRAGFEQGRAIWKYVRDCSLPDIVPDEEITVWDITDHPSAGETLAVVAAPALGIPEDAATLLFALPGHPHWRNFSAEVDGEIVSFGSLLIDGATARVCLDGTLAHARGRGCNLALLRRRVLAALEAGCETLYAEVREDNDGQTARGRNLLRAGFIPAYLSMNWQRPR